MTGHLAGMAEEEYESEDEDVADTMAAYQSAKRRLAAATKKGQRGSRGGKGSGSAGRGSSVGRDSEHSLEDKKAESRCADCGRVGH